MKTRIISGIVMVAIVLLVLLAGIHISSLFITAFAAILAAISNYELIYNAAGIKYKPAIAGACVFAFLNVIIGDNIISSALFDIINPISNSISDFHFTSMISVIYFLYAVIMILKNHNDFSLAHISVLCAMPIVISYAFGTLGSIINARDGIYYLLMLLNFSSICDMGAYFVGVTLGKHKLCPEISPKKTIEGAVGGILSSLIFTVVFAILFNRTDMIIPALICTIPLCIVGMLGDLFASAIKRSVGIKDYGALIPGHGGILDRFDSILMLSPVIYLCMKSGVL